MLQLTVEDGKRYKGRRGARKGDGSQGEALVLFINRIRMSVCLSFCLFVCLFVLKLLLGKSIDIDESYITGCAIFRGSTTSNFEPDTITW